MEVTQWERRAITPPQAPALTVAPVVPASGASVAISVEPAGWEDLAAQVAACTKCELHTGRIQTVFGVGARHAEWLVIGEAPGAEEDKRGEPFVGRAGQLLNSMLAGIGLARETVYIANILKCRPPNNRDPKPDEVLCCEPYLMAQIALLQPKLILAVGRIAAQNLLKVQTPIGKLRGQRHAFGPQAIPLIVTYHPAYLLRSPSEKRRAWEDLLFAQRLFRELA
ncbi:MAG: uracil-DNA glycosylase [Gammaproteobacteria bacterium]|nr:uracil-DNA glycosylase [Gammaproteobacteria bacterium]